MDENKKKEGVSVKEIQEFTKKYRFEVIFCLMFIFAGISGMFGFFFNPGWSILATVVGAVLSIVVPTQVESILKKVTQFVFGENGTVQLVLGVVSLVLAILIPFLTFLLLGAFGGKAIHVHAMGLTKK